MRSETSSPPPVPTIALPRVALDVSESPWRDWDQAKRNEVRSWLEYVTGEDLSDAYRVEFRGDQVAIYRWHRDGEGRVHRVRDCPTPDPVQDPLALCRAPVVLA